MKGAHGESPRGQWGRGWGTAAECMHEHTVDTFLPPNASGMATEYACVNMPLLSIHTGAYKYIIRVGSSLPCVQKVCIAGAKQPNWQRMHPCTVV